MKGSIDALTVVVAVSVVFVIWMLVELAFLLRLRFIEERDALDCVRQGKAIARDLLTAIGDRDSERGYPAFDTATLPARREAVLGLLQLMRGGDRERLFAIAEHAHLFDRACKLVRARRAARRLEGLHELELFGSPVCLEAIRERLACDPERSVRLEAASALTRLGHVPDFALIVDALDLRYQVPTRLHAALYRAIAKSDPEALMAATRRDDLARQRAFLVDALAETKLPGVLPLLEEHGGSDDPEVRCAALRAARHVGHPAAGPWVTQRLHDDFEQVRVQAVQTAAALRARDAIPSLIALLEDQSWWVRTRAGEALDALGGASRDPVSATRLTSEHAPCVGLSQPLA